MRLFVDIENRKLVQSLVSDRIAPAPSFMQGDNEPLEIHLLGTGTSSLFEDKILNPEHDFLRVGIARFKGEPKLLSIGSFYTTLENGGCILTLPLNTVEIEAALGNNPSLDAYLEIEYSTSEGRITTVLQTSCKVRNDLIEDAPNVEIEDQYLNKSEIEGIFLKKSDNLESVEDKGQARTNLGVYSKTEIDSKNGTFLTKADNLASLSDKEKSRTNLDVYSKTESDTKIETLLPKSDNLASLADKETARENLGVYSKDETDENFLSKSDNLASLENKDVARQNLNAAPFDIYKTINTLGSFNGVYSRSSFDYYQYNYGEGLGGSAYDLVDTFTILTTFLCTSSNSYVVGNSSYYETDIEVRNNGSILYYGYTYDESWNYINNEIVLSSPIEYGDKLAITLKDRILCVYKNAELVGEQEVPEGTKFYRPTYVLNYTGLKKHFAYSDNFALPLTKAEGTASGYGYSIEEWANNVPLPLNLLFSMISFTKPNYSTALGSGSWLKGIAPKIFAGVSNTMVIYKEKNTYGRDYVLFPSSTGGYAYYHGVYLFKMRVYIPSSNTNGKKIYVRCSSYSITTSSYIEVLSRKNIDEKGYVTELDAWVDVELKFRWKQQSHSFGSMYIHLVNEANTFQFMGTNDDTDERFYIASSSIKGLEGFNAYYEGGLQANAWVDRTGNGHDMQVSNHVGIISYPPDTVSATRKTLSVENFSWSSYQYDFLPIGYEIVQIVITPNQAIQDTSNVEEDYYKNILRIYDGSREICKHHLPAIPANTSYIIQPINGFNLSYSNFSIDAMYSVNFGGKITFYLQKNNE